jgi:hypothetical protein
MRLFRLAAAAAAGRLTRAWLYLVEPWRPVPRPVHVPVTARLDEPFVARPGYVG